MADAEASTDPPKDVVDREKSLGITLRVGSHNRFAGILKQRYEDFSVREVDHEGIPVKLTNFKHIDPEVDPSMEDEDEPSPFSAEEQKMIEEFVDQGEVGHEDDQISLVVTEQTREDTFRM